MIVQRAMRPSPGALRRAAGFTLMEIMVVVIIIGVLAAIALPLYQESMRKSRRADAKQALLDVANREEQFMLDRSTYTADMTELGYAADPMISGDGHYQVDRIDCDAISDGLVDGTEQACPSVCSDDTVTCYVLAATPLTTSPQSKDLRCTSFTLDSTGAQSATGKDKDNCW